MKWALPSSVGKCRESRYRGISGDRHTIMINPATSKDSDTTMATASTSSETNFLLALDHHGPDAQTPAAKAIPIRLDRNQ